MKSIRNIFIILILHIAFDKIHKVKSDSGQCINNLKGIFGDISPNNCIKFLMLCNDYTIAPIGEDTKLNCDGKYELLSPKNLNLRNKYFYQYVKHIIDNVNYFPYRQVPKNFCEELKRKYMEIYINFEHYTIYECEIRIRQRLHFQSKLDFKRMITNMILGYDETLPVVNQDKFEIIKNHLEHQYLVSYLDVLIILEGMKNIDYFCYYTYPEKIPGTNKYVGGLIVNKVKSECCKAVIAKGFGILKDPFECIRYLLTYEDHLSENEKPKYYFPWAYGLDINRYYHYLSESVIYDNIPTVEEFCLMQIYENEYNHSKIPTIVEFFNMRMIYEKKSNKIKSIEIKRSIECIDRIKKILSIEEHYSKRDIFLNIYFGHEIRDPSTIAMFDIELDNFEHLYIKLIRDSFLMLIEGVKNVDVFCDEFYLELEFNIENLIQPPSLPPSGRGGGRDGGRGGGSGSGRPDKGKRKMNEDDDDDFLRQFEERSHEGIRFR